MFCAISHRPTEPLRWWGGVVVAIAALTTSTLASAARAASVGLDGAKLPGVVLDNTTAQLTGTWKDSTHTAPFVGAGYIHDDNSDKGNRSVRFQPNLAEAGEYEVRISYSIGSSRATNVPVEIHTTDGVKTLTVNQRVRPSGGVFYSLGRFRLPAGESAAVVISNRGTDGHVIVDAVQLLTPPQAEQVARQEAQANKLAKGTKKLTQKTKPANPKPAAKKTDNQSPGLVWKPPQRKLVEELTPAQLDALVAKDMAEESAGKTPTAPPLDDELLLRRASLDLIGRPPTLEERQVFLADDPQTRHAALVERLLASKEFGRNWANYWSDTIGARIPQPELTFLNYDPLKSWLADMLNRGAGWDEISWTLLTATGKVADNPAATFVGFHQANPERLTSESTRIFLGINLACAECHDHKFESWEQEQFHQLAAFFVRTEAKLPWNDSGGILVSSKAKGEHKMPGGTSEMRPVVLESDEGVDLGADDLERRRRLAEWMASDRNEYFAKAYVNRIWSRLMGRGFYEPVDHLTENASPTLPTVHDHLAEHFAASGFDVKGLFRLVMNTEAYRRGLPQSRAQAERLYAAAIPSKLRGDEVFASLVTALRLPNVTPPPTKADGAFRFPPPPKDTHDLVSEAFGYDPSVDLKNVSRTMQQAMWMMNNDQLQRQIDADPDSGTVLAGLLAAEKDDRKAVTKLYLRVLAREPSADELDICLSHLGQANSRGEGFEDLLWSLLNSAEFTTRR